MNRELILTILFSFTLVCTLPAQERTLQEKENERNHRTVELLKKLHPIYTAQSQPGKLAVFPRPDRAEYQQWLDEEFVPLRRYDHNYQNGERVETEILNFNSQNESWQPYEKSIYQYSSDGLESIVDQVYAGGNYYNSSRILFTYQQVNGITTIFTETEQFWDSSNEVWVNEGQIRFTAEGGQISMFEDGFWNGDHWVYVDRTLISEENGDLIFVYQELFDDEWEDLYRDTYPSITFPDLIDQFYEFFIDTIEFGSEMAYFGYLPDVTEQNWTGFNWVDDYRRVTAVTTDPSTGEVELRSVIEQDSDGSEWITFSEIQIEYENEKPVLFTLYEPNYYSDEDELIKFSQEVFQYDQNDRMTEITRTEYIYAFDGDGSLLEEEILDGRVLLTYGDTSTSAERLDDTRPNTYRLGNAYPNPFNPQTTVPFQAGQNGFITIKVYDLLGRYVMTLAQGIYPQGNHTVRFDASALTSGVYMIRMEAPDMQQVRRVTLLK
ncbi:T9SS type A sorting domain-containing protein [Rhodohalobacter sp. SW132]|uniref:T9SS type A sorting domain-containing protein n=1 Tax=Rhodohalobacter sp. SW132 TaxID=2293433 RepID=UPI0013141405|nr:T9SS type A sorting domain-containing protein [Rhodohalobacter sp. SW132]